MSKIKIKTRHRKYLSDTVTPVGIYLKIRDRFAHSFLLESSDYRAAHNSFSYICCDPIAFLKVEGDTIVTRYPDQSPTRHYVGELTEQIDYFVSSFEFKGRKERFIKAGLFGYIGYDAVGHMEEVNLGYINTPIPSVQYHLFRFIIVLDHFKNECHIMEAFVDRPNDALLKEVVALSQRRSLPDYPFGTTREVTSSMTDDDYLKAVKKGIHHCRIGDVFQVVLSRRFTTSFYGDDFQVYRALRSINPSPYLFYFDYGNFRIFGSSPEAQLVLQHGTAEIHPIAGTFRRTGDDAADAALAQQLLNDPKEAAEHVMLVDLARNDLSRYCNKVRVESYKEIQYYSHVIHLASKVKGNIMPDASFMDIVAATFPAGTLSGAPKIRAMEIIREYERETREFYGGAVGFMDFNGRFNHAILIRSFFSHNNTLTFQAGAGIVAQSKPENELQEVYNKVGALTSAIRQAEKP